MTGFFEGISRDQTTLSPSVWMTGSEKIIPVAWRIWSLTSLIRERLARTGRPGNPRLHF